MGQFGPKMDKMWKMGWGETTAVGCVWERCPREGVDPTSGCERVSHAQGHPNQRWWGSRFAAGTLPSPGEGAEGRWGGNNSPSTISLMGHPHGAGAKDCAAQSGQGRSWPKKHPPKGQKGGDGERRVRAAMPKSSRSQS